MQDPPSHDRLRGAVMAKFTPSVIESLRAEVRRLANKLLDSAGSRSRLDLVDEVAYPLPVSVICTLLGVPEQDAARFHAWADSLARSIDVDPNTSQEEINQISQAAGEFSDYLEKLTADRAGNPGEDLISGLLTGSAHSEPLRGDELVVTARLLLIAGHETTVNLLTNGVLTLLRHPGILERFRGEPDLVVPMVEELVRYEPSVQFRYRATLADIDIGGTTIPPRLRRGPATGRRQPRPQSFQRSRAFRPRPGPQRALRLRRRDPLLHRSTAGPHGGTRRAPRGNPAAGEPPPGGRPAPVPAHRRAARAPPPLARR
jgi:hypothetical protein